MGDDKISEKDLGNLITQLERVNGDKDRIRLVNAASDGFSFDCEQIKRLVDVVQYGDAVTTTAINLYGKCTDPDRYESVVLAALQFDEDRATVKDAIGL